MIDGTTNVLRRKALEQKYLECFDAHSIKMEKWREIVLRLIDRGVSRGTLMNWAVDAGHPRITVSSILRRILVSLGLREHRKRAGRKPSSKTLELLCNVCIRYGDPFLKVLRAAVRAGRVQIAADGSQSEPWASTAHAPSQVQMSCP
jgi:hypothetical protein